MKSTTTIITAVLIATFAVSTVHAQGSIAPETSSVPPMPPKNRLEQNRDSRNITLDLRQEIHADVRMDVKALHASTTDMFKRAKDMRKDIAKKMEMKVFEIRKAALVKELTVSLTNITNISTRIDARMKKVESEGHSMTEARALFVIATTKLEKAKADVAAFQALSITASTTGVTTGSTSSTTTQVQVDLMKPRVLGDAAIKSVKDARDAFQKVIVAIAHALGASITASTTSSKI